MDQVIGDQREAKRGRMTEPTHQKHRKIHFDGRIIKEEDIFVLIVEGPNWTTYDRAYDKVLNDVSSMVLDHLRAYEDHDQLEQYLRRLGVTGPLPEYVDVIIHIDCSQVIPALKDTTIACSAYPIRRAA